jgi:hypothetical protein
MSKLGNTAKKIKDDVPDDVIQEVSSEDALKQEFAKSEVKEAKTSQSTVLAQLADEHYEFFKSADGTAYAEIQTETENARRELSIKVQTVPVKSAAFRNFLSALYFNRTGTAVRRGAIDDAIAVLLGRIQLHAAEQAVFVRLGENLEVNEEWEGESVIWLDLADSAHRAVKISAHGWKVVSGLQVHVKFLRRSGMLPLPTPRKSPNSLRHLLSPFLNIQNNRHRQLVMTWLAFTLHPKGAKPILALEGEAGSAKTTASKILRSSVDPSEAMLIDLPRKAHDCVIAAQNSLVLAYDNISSIPDWFSDTMCRMSTGQGHRTRELYSDGEEKIFSAMRPQIINSIEDVTYRGDFLDRAIRVIFDPIPDEKRIGDAEMDEDFKATLPFILGALCNVLSLALREQNNVVIEKKPRMADFATFGVAVEEILGFGQKSFLAAYENNRDEINSLVLNASPLAHTIMRLLRKHSGCWKGNSTLLLRALNDVYESDASDSRKKPKSWPTTVAELTGALRRVTPALRRKNIEMVRKASNGRRILIIREKRQ